MTADIWALTPTAGRRPRRFILLGPVIGLALLSTMSGEEHTACPYALATGSACPGCGMTRAVLDLFRGDFVASVTFHPLAMLVVAQGVIWGAWYVLRRGNKVRPLSRGVANLIVVLNAVALIAIWGLRAASGTLPPV